MMANDSNQKFLGIILVLDGGNEPIYNKFRETWQRIAKSEKTNGFKVFLIRYSPKVINNIEFDHPNNTMLIKGVEPNSRRGKNLLDKTLIAIAALNKIYNYDFIIRTNLSTIWHIPDLHKFLKTKPTARVMGIVNGGRNMSGTAMIFSRKVANQISVSGKLVNRRQYEDVLLSLIVKRLGYRIEAISGRCDLSQNTTIGIRERIDACYKKGAYFFRVKNIVNREVIDSKIVDELMSYFYPSEALPTQPKIVKH